ncbi:MAG: universal stress protein [Acidobacteria bacterium]|nr:universal stress protein [Acidobacteriota bacterium]
MKRPFPQRFLKAAEANSADLIAITVPKRSWLERAVLGSVAEDIIREADMPVLSIPVRTEAKQQQPPAFAA